MIFDYQQISTNKKPGGEGKLGYKKPNIPILNKLEKCLKKGLNTNKHIIFDKSSFIRVPELKSKYNYED